MITKAKSILIYLGEFILNYIVTWIPFWAVRKTIYRAFGMRIGSKSRILMGTAVYAPWRIAIGNGCVINEKCLLDGRGNITICDHVSVSRGTLIYTGTHDIRSGNFAFRVNPVYISDNVWLCANTIVLPNVYMGYGVILAAGSVARPGNYEKLGIYSGVPAVYVGDRKLESAYVTGNWKPWFR